MWLTFHLSDCVKGMEVLGEEMFGSRHVPITDIINVKHSLRSLTSPHSNYVSYCVHTLQLTSQNIFVGTFFANATFVRHVPLNNTEQPEANPPCPVLFFFSLSVNVDKTQDS